MTNREAIDWLGLIKYRDIEFDDYSEDTKRLREKAMICFQEALNLGIQALKNQQSIIEELESVKSEIDESFSSSVSDCVYIIDKRITELKGENKDVDS